MTGYSAQRKVNYYTRELMDKGGNPPIGIVLYADKSDAIVKYTLPIFFVYIQYFQEDPPHTSCKIYSIIVLYQGMCRPCSTYP